MSLDRRRLMLGGASFLASSGLSVVPSTGREPERLDALLAAHAGKLPERAGAGANHYPMAAEALEALGREDAIEESWGARGAALYDGELVREGSVLDDADALGDYSRVLGWLDHFRAELAGTPWRDVLARWAPRLAPGLSGAALHGLIRTAHATRALERHESAARRDELAAGLAYWAARHTVLPTSPDAAPRPDEGLRAFLARQEHPWLDDVEDVPFHEVDARLARAPVAPPVPRAEPGPSPRADLDALVREAATAFLEMLVLERHRIWLLHTVTGPAAVELLLPHVDDAGARLLVDHAWQAVLALYAAFGAPYPAGAHVRATPPGWPALVDQVVATRSIHGIKLTEALVRLDPGDDTLHRSVCAQWLEWK